MKNLINQIQSTLGIQSNRTKNITKHVFWSFIYKGGHIIANFLLVPLTIDFLDTENYGIWLTLSSFIAWFSFFDIGLGNGLRNKFAEAKAKGDLELAKGFVSTAYYTIGIICILFLGLTILISFVVDWSKIFNTSAALNSQLQILMPIVFACFSFQLILNLITSIYTADQNHSMQGKISFFNAAVSLLLIWLLTLTTKSSLIIYGVIFSVLPVVILLIINLYAFNNKYKHFKPEKLYWKKEHLKNIFGLGISFFIIQLAGIILFSTDNFIITQIYGPKEVVPYNVSYKYLSISLMILNIMVAPFWSSITEAYTKGDLVWIKKSMQNLIKISFGIIILILLLVLLAPFAYRIWLNDVIVIPFSLTVSMATLTIITVLYTPFTYFINGTGKIRLQKYTLLITSVFNIPLSFFLAKFIFFGTEGVVIATIVCLTPHLILCPIQYYKIINKQDTGLWSK